MRNSFLKSKCEIHGHSSCGGCAGIQQLLGGLRQPALLPSPAPPRTLPKRSSHTRAYSHWDLLLWFVFLAALETSLFSVNILMTNPELWRGKKSINKKNIFHCNDRAREPTLRCSSHGQPNLPEDPTLASRPLLKIWMSAQIIQF